MSDQVLNGASKNLEDTLTDCDHQKMTDSLMQKLQQVKNESSSDEESQEHKNLMFEDAASSAGREYLCIQTHSVMLQVMVLTTNHTWICMLLCFVFCLCEANILYGYF